MTILRNLITRRTTGIPSAEMTIKLIGDVTTFMYPAFTGMHKTCRTKRKVQRSLCRVLSSVASNLSDPPGVVADRFTEALEDIKKKADADACYIMEGDPAATSVEEVIITYPGFYAILVYRLANKLALLEVPLIPRIMTEYAHSLTGIDIHPGAVIDSPFFIDHGTGVVIGETSVIGKRVKIYQGVTIGALSVSKSMAGTKRHPTIEDDVIIYAGSTILGGDTVIGHDSIIGGNVWLTSPVPPYSLVYHENVIRIRERNNNKNH
ncbi:MAG: serine acetyltransferase [Bacteroidales bacterium]|nr:serine acetyltransferase [Bacteroidales bacterium]